MPQVTADVDHIVYSLQSVRAESMAESLTAREKFFSLNGLVCLGQALEGEYTVIDLRDESCVTGKIEQVDSFMNVYMSDAVFINSKGDKHAFDTMFVQARNIRYVHIPDRVSIIGAIEKQLGTIRKPMEKRSTKSKLSFKELRARRTHAATVAKIKSETRTEETKSEIKTDKIKSEIKTEKK